MATAVAATAVGTAFDVGMQVAGVSQGSKGLKDAEGFFKMQMRQARRQWAADFAEGSWRHAKACLQSARKHAEGMNPPIWVRVRTSIGV